MKVFGHPTKPQRPPLTDAQRYQIADLCRRGVPRKEVARQFHCSQTIISLVVTRARKAEGAK